MTRLIDISGFGNDTMKFLGHVNVALELGVFESQAMFHVVNFKVPYQFLIGWIWMHVHGIVSSTYHQCAKLKVNDEEVKFLGLSQAFFKNEAI